MTKFEAGSPRALDFDEAVKLLDEKELLSKYQEMVLIVRDEKKSYKEAVEIIIQRQS